MASPNTTNNEQQGELEINIGTLLSICLAKWRWFVLSLFVVLVVAVLYLLRTPPTYTRFVELLIKEDSKGKSATGNLSSMFSELGFSGTDANVYNELAALRSPATVEDMVKRLHLETEYLTPGLFHKEVAYGVERPVSVEFIDLTDEESAGFTLQMGEDGVAEVSHFTYLGEEISGEIILPDGLPDTLSTPIGQLVFLPTFYYIGEPSYTLEVYRSGLHNVINAYMKKIDVDLVDTKSTVIRVTFKDVSIQRAEDGLNTLLSVYDGNWMKNKNMEVVSTSLFINGRLGLIEQELGGVDEEISAYKSEHLMPDVQSAASMYMSQSSQTDAQLLELNNQLYMARYVRECISNMSASGQLLPAGVGIGSTSIESQISDYNKQLLQRNSLVANSSPRNPLVVDMDQALTKLREAVAVSLDNQIVAIETQIRNLQEANKENADRIAATPIQEKYLLSVERQQKVKEELYLFLLQKREDNELLQAFTSYNTQVITPPYGDMLPTSPVKRNILLIAIVIGLFIPGGIIFLREVLYTKIRGRKDLESLTLPFVGEVPLYQKRKGFFGFRKKRDTEKNLLVVKAGGRDVINEAFRVLRTNLEFMCGESGKGEVVAITSFNAGSGKSFLTANIAVSLAIKEKRVLMIDGDLRKGTLSSYAGSPKVGLSDYLGGRVERLSDIIIHREKYGELYLLPMGMIPPNPAELLFDSRFGEMITAFREEYDFILIDCPPIEIVADTQIISKWADRTLFVVRAGLFEREMLPSLEALYKEEKYKNMALILNGTESHGSHYGHRYGYGYGYWYGYGYGYGYGVKEKRRKRSKSADSDE